jgi:hypothetical protein
MVASWSPFSVLLHDFTPKELQLACPYHVGCYLRTHPADHAAAAAAAADAMPCRQLADLLQTLGMQIMWGSKCKWIDNTAFANQAYKTISPQGIHVLPAVSRWNHVAATTTTLWLQTVLEA